MYLVWWSFAHLKVMHMNYSQVKSKTSDNITKIVLKRYYYPNNQSIYSAFIIYPNKESPESRHLPMVLANSPMPRWTVLLYYLQLSETLKLWNLIPVTNQYALGNSLWLKKHAMCRGMVQIVYNHHAVLVHRPPQMELNYWI